MKAIIVAAGRGSRLVPHTDHYPKCFIPFAGRRLIDWQIDSLKAAGADEIVIVRGYQGHSFDGLKFRCFDNPRWAETNMVYSLMCAREALVDGSDWIIAYGDIVYEPRIPVALVQSAGDAGVIVDKEWLKLWSLRADDPLADAESLKIGADQNLTDIGVKPVGMDRIDAQYIGLLRFSADAMKRLIAFYDHAAPDAAWLLGRPKEKCYMTDLVRGLIEDGMPIKAVSINSGWLEFDTNSDLDSYTRMLADGSLAQFWSQPR